MRKQWKGVLGGGVALLLSPLLSWAAMGYLVGEQVTGQTKQCYYDYLGSRYTLTIRVTALCPLTLEIHR